jgi:hypothetical protein
MNQKSNTTIAVCLVALSAWTNATAQDVQFKLLRMWNGQTKSGAECAGRDFESPDHVKLWSTTVYLSSRDGAMKEYRAVLNGAAKIISDGKLGTGTEAGEHRAVVLVTGGKDCERVTEIVFTRDTELHLLESCSADNVFEFEKQAGRK